MFGTKKFVWCYASFGTDIAYGATRPFPHVDPRYSVLRVCYAMCGTDVAYAATSLLRDVRY
eukprot:3605813-Rhodomonas_salina.1